MPVSEFYHIPFVLHIAQATCPSTILDVGIGTGTYGFLMRNFFDFSGCRFSPDSWSVRIDGIEAFESYRNDVWDAVYNDVHIGDMRDIMPQIPGYDLILFNDVLEHLDISDALQCLYIALDRSKCVIVTTPNDEWPQGPVHGNEWEVHRCIIRSQDLPHVAIERRAVRTTCYVCCKDNRLRRDLRTEGLRCPAYMSKWLQPRRLMSRLPLYIQHLRRRAGLSQEPREGRNSD